MIPAGPSGQFGALQMETLRLVDRLHDSALQLSTASAAENGFVQTVIEDLSSAVEELRVAGEELRVQGDELALMTGSVESERQRYQDLFEFAPDAYLLTDASGTIQEANRAIASLLGFARKYVLGKPLAAFVERDGSQDFLSRLTRLRGTEGEWVREWDMRLRPRRYGGAVDANVRVAPVRNRDGTLTGLRWVLRDVSARKQAETAAQSLGQEVEARVRERTAQLEAALRINQTLLAQEQQDRPLLEARCNRLVEHAFGGVFRLGTSGRIQEANLALARMLGYATSEELLAAAPDMDALGLERSRIARFYKPSEVEGEVQDFIVIARHRDGNELRLQIRVWPVRGTKDAIVGVEGTVLDLTNQEQSATLNGAHAG